MHEYGRIGQPVVPSRDLSVSPDIRREAQAAGQRAEHHQLGEEEEHQQEGGNERERVRQAERESE